MPANELPSSSSSNIVQGSFDYFYLERRIATGAVYSPAETPVTQKVAIIGELSLDYKGDDAATKDIEVKTPAFGRKYIAGHAADVSSAAATAPLNLTATLLIKESSMKHLNLPSLLNGKYYNLILPLGIRGTLTVDMAIFGKFDISTQQKFVDGKETDFALKFLVQNNTVSNTVTLPTDTNIHATSLVIPVNTGFLLAETA